ncbi:MAG: type II toxin-antitoxin system Phd/YefM family antitoxin [Planctomycetes bacterium]|nr:type II toxin-antitoxin system Phd/YefM family antitoxin [Planctomycetota bacterium]
MKSAKVSELKARLSAYLAEVRRGGMVVVLDRNTPIARIVPYEEQVEKFRIEEPGRPKSDLKRVHGVRPRRPVDVVRLLREDRDPR